ncbi:Integral membrane protein [hydrothermal vent metagenome]|uniref:Integral membrane protein n=1 Tax=hydrothermal vent metagenome TaxID=652676 RepID=A0A3B1DAP3_9ZZZZ
MNKFAPLFVIVAASLWGVDSIVLRPHLYTLPVPLVVFLESMIVAILLMPILFRKFSDLKNLKSMDLLAFGGVALFGGAIGTMAITKALFYVNYVNLSVVVLIQKLQPVFALILAAILLKEKLPKIFFIWAGIAIVGAFLMTFGMKIPNIDTGDKTFVASLFALLAAFSFGFSTVLSKRALRNVTYELGTYLRFVITTVFMMVIIGITGDISSIREVTDTQWMIFLIIAFTSGGLAIFLYYYGLKRISASVATIAELSFPLTAILLEYIIHDNILDWVQWIGAILLIYSIIQVSRVNLQK